MRLQECASGSQELQESDKVETGFLTTVCYCVIYGSDSQRSVQTGPMQVQSDADIKVGKHAKDIKEKPKDNMQLNFSNMLAKRREDEERKKKG